MGPTTSDGCVGVAGGIHGGGVIPCVGTAGTSEGGGGGGGGVDGTPGSAGTGGGGGVLLKKGPWTAAEDAILVEYVRKHGEGNWNAVQKHSGLARCGKSCRLRWANHLRPNLRKGAFSPQEERLILELHAKFGNKWARMASLLPGRTDNEIKNYWNTRVKRHQRQGLPLYPPDLQPNHPDNLQHHHHHHHQPHLQHHHHHLHRSHSAPTTPNVSFTFQTTPQHQHHHHQSLHSPSNPSAPSPLTSNSPPPPLSPLSSPSTATTPPPHLFDFYHHHRPTPVLQTPPRFKRFSANDLSIYDITTNITTTPQFALSPSLPSFAPFAHSNDSSPLPNQQQPGPCYFPSTPTSTSSSLDFHKELQRENQKMCSIFAAVANSHTAAAAELPSDPLFFSSPASSLNWDSGIGNCGAAANKFGSSRVGGKRKHAEIDELGTDNSGTGLLEDLLHESKVLNLSTVASSDEHNCLVSQEHKPNRTILPFTGFDVNCDQSKVLTLSPESKAEVETATGQQLNTMPDDQYLIKQLSNQLPSTTTQAAATLYGSDNGDISNGTSSVVTDDTLDFDMQQIALLFPNSTDQDKTYGSCSWDSLPRMC
ncbi:hypothetical protein Tsubulata_002347 [Turnera subulata]|uniref:Uncharacterized protein n=1 Tax=Turnera subulata TaxID=218843 RepID=A0A9Q0G8X6_9ROSI|nr:hypothetical protein Tsubulata_002347 [Turnera subulata]